MLRPVAYSAPRVQTPAVFTPLAGKLKEFPVVPPTPSLVSSPPIKSIGPLCAASSIKTGPSYSMGLPMGWAEGGIPRAGPLDLRFR